MNVEMKALASQVADLKDAKCLNVSYYDDGAHEGVIVGPGKDFGTVAVRWLEDGSIDKDVRFDQIKLVSAKAESDKVVTKRIADRFKRYELLLYGVATGNLSGVVVSGPGGIGKTYEAERVMNEILGTKEVKVKPRLFDDDGADVGPDMDAEPEIVHEPRYTHVTGHISPMGLYQTLYENSGPEDVLIFDDCDSVWDGDLTLNLLKAALDTKERRIISWESNARNLDAPRSFQFKGRIVFLTNKMMDGEHFNAFKTRVHCVDLNLSRREIILKMEMTMAGVTHKGATDEDKKEVFKVIKANQDSISDISMRTFIKLLDIYMMFKNDERFDLKDWKTVALAQ